MKTSIALTILCLVLAVVPASAQNWTYDNGPISGRQGAFEIVNGFFVSDTFNLSSGQTVNSFSFGAWNEGSDPMISLQWSLTSAENGGTVYGSGTALSGGGSGGTLVSQFLSENSFGYDIDLITVTGLNVNFATGGTYWLSLQNAQSKLADYFFWDENNGIGCGGGGCPSSASDSGIGTIPSESFTIGGTGAGTTPEPGSIMLFGSGILGLAGVVRRKLM